MNQCQMIGVLPSYHAEKLMERVQNEGWDSKHCIWLGPTIVLANIASACALTLFVVVDFLALLILRFANQKESALGVEHWLWKHLSFEVACLVKIIYPLTTQLVPLTEEITKAMICGMRK